MRSPPQQAEAPVRPGDTIAGKYRVERVLGAGGMGVVVAAQHLQLGERVALKFLLPDMAGFEEAVVRFDREARAAVKIKSEHVARISDVGKLETGAPYMVMEYLEGGDLCGWLRDRGPLEIEQAVEFVLQACEAVAEAHSLGIIHRDLKPANLFCIRRADGVLSIKVLDFGISKVSQTTTTGLDGGITRTQEVLGSPPYMSPEQLHSSKDVDPRSDIWALGVTLYELLTGSLPFAANSQAQLVVAIATQPAPSARESRPDVPWGLEQVITRCLEKPRALRFQNVAELAAALVPFAPKRAKASAARVLGIIQSSGMSASALALPPSSDPETAGAVSNTTAVWERSTTIQRPRWKLPVILAASLVLLCGLAAWAFSFLRSERPAPEPGRATSASVAAPASVSPEPSASSLGQEPVLPQASALTMSSSAASAAPPTTGISAKKKKGTTSPEASGEKTASAPPPPQPTPATSSTGGLGGRL